MLRLWKFAEHHILYVPRSVIPISLCSDRFPHQCLKGIIRVNRAVIFEVAIFLLLSLFWTNHQPQHQPPPPTLPSNNRFRPTAFPPPQPHAPLNKPRHPHQLRQPRSNHPQNNHHHPRHYARLRPPSSTDHVTTVSTSETVRERAREIKARAGSARAFVSLARSRTVSDEETVVAWSVEDGVRKQA